VKRFKVKMSLNDINHYAIRNLAGYMSLHDACVFRIATMHSESKHLGKALLQERMEMFKERCKELNIPLSQFVGEDKQDLKTFMSKIHHDTN
jgi:hypothetical protein